VFHDLGQLVVVGKGTARMGRLFVVVMMLVFMLVLMLVMMVASMRVTVSVMMIVHVSASEKKRK
jgi:hypothetical protein